ncbi:MAG: dTMP kinase [Planctomycetes bacterium]|nr:dTMP kinase [Planctomycetota bacterium]
MSTDDATLADRLRGKFLVFDGPDGAGKTTQGEILLGLLQSANLDVVTCRDPGGTEIGDRIRAVLLDFDLSTMDAACEALLFMASRAQLVKEVVRPAIDSGKTVLCDRFVTSTCAYQGAAGFDPQRVIELARFAIGECWPDVTLIFDVDPAKGFERIGRHAHHAGKHRKRASGQSTLFEDAGPDAMEARSIDYHRRVRKIFLDVHQYYPTPVITVDGSGDRKAVHQRVTKELLRVLG